MSKYMSAIVGLAAFVVAVCIVWQAPKPTSPPDAPRISPSPAKFPVRDVAVEDFQTPEDEKLLSQFNQIVNQIDSDNPFSKFLNEKVKQYDDLSTTDYEFNAVEVTALQFPDRPEIWRAVEDCAKILNMPETPRVFVLNSESSHRLQETGIFSLISYLRKPFFSKTHF